MKMETKKRSLGEMMKNPDNWTDEEKEDYKKMVEKFSEFGKSIKAYTIDKEIANNTTEVISERFYKEFFIMSAILEAFYVKDKISFVELNQNIYNHVPKEFLYEMSVSYQNLIISKMIRLGFIEVLETGDKYMPDFKITPEGVKIYQEQQLQSIAASSFFSHQALSLNKKTEKLNIIILWLTGLMLVVTICSVIVTILSLKN